jgi:succinate dehydrogenase flavin-adding protein (antitoxin of CptAB toxin-antitoxin module)
VRDHVATMSATELAELEQLVDLADPMLARLIFQRHPVGEVGRTAIVAKLLAWRLRTA